MYNTNMLKCKCNEDGSLCVYPANDIRIGIGMSVYDVNLNWESIDAKLVSVCMRRDIEGYEHKDKAEKKSFLLVCVISKVYRRGDKVRIHLLNNGQSFIVKEGEKIAEIIPII